MQFTCGTRQVTLPTTNTASGTSPRGVKPSGATSHHHPLQRGHIAGVSVRLQALRNLHHATCTANACCCPLALGHSSHGLQTTPAMEPKPNTTLNALPSLYKRALSAADISAKASHICKEEDEECAQATFDAKGLEIEYSRGQRYLSGFIGSEISKEECLGEKVVQWTVAVDLLAKVAVKDPQTVYTGFTFYFQNKWQYVLSWKCRQHVVRHDICRVFWKDMPNHAIS